jgi:hypothetical protein
MKKNQGTVCDRKNYFYDLFLDFHKILEQHGLTGYNFVKWYSVFRIRIRMFRASQRQIGTDPRIRIRIRTKMSRIRNTIKNNKYVKLFVLNQV